MILAAMPGPEGLTGPAATCDPALTALFTPPNAKVGRYEVCTTNDPIEVVIVADRRGGPDRPDRLIEALESLDAFGAAGPYDRSRLARLYGGRRVRVARVWTESGDSFESVTLLSPYPDASLTRLMPGTMVIRWKCERGNAECQMLKSDRRIWP